MIVLCTFTSVWNGNEVVSTPGTYDPDTGEVTCEVSNGPIPEGTLDREFVTLPDGTELEVCTDCHEYVERTFMGQRADLSYGEITECTNPECDSNL